MNYRLGLDLGTNSIGWCIVDLDENGAPCGIRDMGVRIFSDGRTPKNGASLGRGTVASLGQVDADGTAISSAANG